MTAPTGRTGRATEAPERRRDGGFGLVEAIIAIMILAIGVVGLAGVSGFVTRQLTLSQMTTERAAALRTAVEQVRAIPYDELVAGSDDVGEIEVSWTVEEDGRSKVVTFTVDGPGLSSAGGGIPVLSPSVEQTFTYRILDES